jgi:anti-sigma B factor antagonist
MGQDDRPNSFRTLTVKRRSLTGAICVSVSGEVDLANASELLGHLNAVAEADDHLIVDLSGLRYIDSSGIRALVDAHRLFTTVKRQMVLAATMGTVKKVVNIVGVDQMVPMFPTVDGALSALRRSDMLPLPQADT